MSSEYSKCVYCMKIYDIYYIFCIRTEA